MRKKNVVVTGVTGQDGSFMVEYLLDATPHDIIGICRRQANPNLDNLSLVLSNPRFSIEYGDLTDSQSIDGIVRRHKPSYFFNFAGQSFVKVSWDLPEMTMDVNATGVLRCLEAIVNHVPDCRFINAGSSEEMGDVLYSPQDILHPPRSRSPYAASKVAAHQLVKSYRDSYKLYALQTIGFNHEGTRRGKEFVTRKITLGVARIKEALDKNQPFEPIELGNLDASRDWSDAEDFVRAFWLIANQELCNPKLREEMAKITDTNYLSHFDGGAEWRLRDRDIVEELSPHLKEYVLSSNETHTIREFIELAFEFAGIKIINTNSEKIRPVASDKGFQVNYTTEDGRPLVVVNIKHYRPADVELLCGNSIPIRMDLGWSPRTSFPNLVAKMIKNDLDRRATGKI